MNNGQRVYESFYDIPFTDNYSVAPRPAMRFSQTEIIHLLISIAVLTIAFSFAFAPTRNPTWTVSTFLSFIPMAFLAIVTAFVFHELAHKYMGQKYGYWSEFRMFPQGLLFALVFGVFFGIVFAAPGAVQIYGNPGKKEYGHISLAGPLTNIVISLVFMIIAFSSTGMLQNTAYFIGYINIFLALFNLLPFGPLDGRKVMSWRFDIWLVFFIIGITIFGIFLTIH